MLVFPRLLNGGVRAVHTFAVFIPCAAAVTGPMQTIPNIAVRCRRRLQCSCRQALERRSPRAAAMIWRSGGGAISSPALDRTSLPWPA